MQRLDYSSADPAVNLALEEVLLDEVAGGGQPPTLRFWESPVPFVVLGTGQVLADEVHEAHCAADSVAIMRRCTAGGCVLQGPGCLNYALFLTTAAVPEAGTLHGSYRYILGRICAALGDLGIEAAQAGISDIAMGGRKISGNAQRRKRDAMLHHGTLLYRPDLAAIDRYIREPRERPDYRGARSHDAFLTTIPAAPTALREAVASAFGCGAALHEPPVAQIRRAEALATDKYRDPAWIRRR